MQKRKSFVAHDDANIISTDPGIWFWVRAKQDSTRIAHLVACQIWRTIWRLAPQLVAQPVRFSVIQRLEHVELCSHRGFDKAHVAFDFANLRIEIRLGEEPDARAMEEWSEDDI